MFKFMNVLISPYLKRVKLESFLKVEQIGVNGHVLLLNPVPPPDLPDSVRPFFVFAAGTCWVFFGLYMACRLS